MATAKKVTKKVKKEAPLVCVNVRISTKEKKNLEKVAKKNKQSVSSFVRALVQALM